MSEQNFISYLISESSKEADITALKKQLQQIQMHYQAGDRHTSDENDRYKNDKKQLQAEINKLQGRKKDKPTPQREEDTIGHQNYTRAQEYIKQNESRLKTLDDSTDKNDKWRAALVRKSLKKANDTIDNYKTKGK